MTDSDTRKERGIGVNAKPDEPSLSSTEVVAASVSLIWLLLCGGYFLFLGSAAEADGSDAVDSLRFVMTLLAVFMPVALIWVAAAAARSSRIVREESRRLQIAIDALRQTYIADRQGRGSAVSSSTVEKKLNEIAHMARLTESRLATFSTSRLAPAPQSGSGGMSAPPPPATLLGDDQPALALGTNVEEVLPPLGRGELIRALNFPDTDKDEEGFSALRRERSCLRASGRQPRQDWPDP